MSDTKIADYTSQTTMHDADYGIGVDTTDTTMSAQGTTKKWTWTTIKAFLKTYFDGLYPTGTLDTDGTLSSNSDTKIPSQKAVKTYVDLGKSTAEGSLLNGKIAVAVASNNITLSLKTLAGADATASTPIYCVIGGVIRTVTSALSVTVNAGANSFNAGSAELATQQIDYFAYLGYNATDGVVIGFSRVPYATSYGEFSATATNEKFCAISTITHAASTDYYNVIGRFAATLGASATYYWTVPAYTSINLIQRPIFETRWSVYVPTWTGFSSAPTGVVANYKINNSSIKAVVTSSGNGTSNTTGLTISVPIGSGSGNLGANYPCLSVDNGAIASAPGIGMIGASSSAITCYKDYTAGNWTASAAKRITGLCIFYELI